MLGQLGKSSTRILPLICTAISRYRSVTVGLELVLLAIGFGCLPRRLADFKPFEFDMVVLVCPVGGQASYVAGRR